MFYIHIYLSQLIFTYTLVNCIVNLIYFIYSSNISFLYCLVSQLFSYQFASIILSLSFNSFSLIPSHGISLETIHIWICLLRYNNCCIPTLFTNGYFSHLTNFSSHFHSFHTFFQLSLSRFNFMFSCDLSVLSLTLLRFSCEPRCPQF